MELRIAGSNATCLCRDEYTLKYGAQANVQGDRDTMQAWHANEARWDGANSVYTVDYAKCLPGSSSIGPDYRTATPRTVPTGGTCSGSPGLGADGLTVYTREYGSKNIEVCLYLP